MIAARLVEAGVAFVEVGQSGYDTHADNFEGHKSLVPPMEHGWAALLDDLEERGLLDDTLIVWAAEFGAEGVGVLLRLGAQFCPCLLLRPGWMSSSELPWASAAETHVQPGSPPVVIRVRVAQSPWS